MFRIPSFYQMEMSYEEAVRIIRPRAETLLDAMLTMDELWNRHCSGQSPYEDDDDFFATWESEVNAYNVIFAGMRKLFHGE